jgi:hypothetical protein
LTTQTTKPSPPEAEQLVPGARHAIAPAGIVSTGWPRVKATCRNIGWRFDPWQDAVGRLILAKAAGGKWAADLSILSIPRQVGKSYLLGCIIFALCLLQPKLRVIWTSHHTATTEEMYEAMKELAQHKRVAPHVAKCIALQGSRWRIVFRNGSRIDFGARERGFGRGKAKVGVLVLDEFQHITMRALSNLTPTTNTADNPLILCAGTPPAPHDNAEAFTQRRKAAIDGLSDDTFYVEFSADQEAGLDDRRQWAKANPSFPKRTPERAFLLNRKVLDDEHFRREFLGIWDELALTLAVVPAEVWRDHLAGELPAENEPPAAISLDRWHDGTTAVAGAWRQGESTHVELLAIDAVRDTAGVVDYVAEMAGRRIPVLIATDSPAASLAVDLIARHVKVKLVAGPDFARSCQAFVDDAIDGPMTHGAVDESTGEIVPQSQLTAALAGATKLAYGKAGAWVWDRRKPENDISPLVAVTLARFGASTSKKTQPRRVVVRS